MRKMQCQAGGWGQRYLLVPNATQWAAETWTRELARYRYGKAQPGTSGTSLNQAVGTFFLEAADTMTFLTPSCFLWNIKRWRHVHKVHVHTRRDNILKNFCGSVCLSTHPLQKGLDQNSWCGRNRSITSVCDLQLFHKRPQQTNHAKGRDPQRG